MRYVAELNCYQKKLYCETAEHAKNSQIGFLNSSQGFFAVGIYSLCKNGGGGGYVVSFPGQLGNETREIVSQGLSRVV